MSEYPFERARPLWVNGNKIEPEMAEIWDDQCSRSADGAVYTDATVAKNWPHQTTVADGRVPLWCPNVTALGIGRWIIAGPTGSNTDFSSYDGKNWSAGSNIVDHTGTPLCAVANGEVLLVGGTPTGSSANKIRRSADGGATWGNVSSVDTGTASVNALSYDAGGGLYIAGLSDGGIETSPDGITWTDRSVPNANSRGSFANNGSLIICTPHSSVGATTNYVLSANGGQTWSQFTTLPSSTWYSCVWSERWGKFFAADGSSIVVSEDGSSWTTVASSLATGPRILLAYRSALISLGLNSASIVGVSSDEGETWKASWVGLTEDSWYGGALGDDQLVVVPYVAASATTSSKALGSVRLGL